MSKQYFVSEGQVLEALNIESFRNLSKEKIMEFVSLIPEMDKDVALSIINQFPVYVESAKTMVEQMNQLCDNLLRDNRASQEDAIMAYKSILKSLNEALERDDTSSEEQEWITNKMIDVADKIAAKDTENKAFLERMYQRGTTIIGMALLFGLALLGVKVKGTIPRVG